MGPSGKERLVSDLEMIHISYVVIRTPYCVQCNMMDSVQILDASAIKILIISFYVSSHFLQNEYTILYRSAANRAIFSPIKGTGGTMTR